MKTVKPETISLLHRTYEVGKRPQLALTAIVYFPFDGPANLFKEGELWRDTARIIPGGSYLTLAMPKAVGEVLVAGKCFPPGGAPSRAGEVRLVVGTVDKRLYVFGNRQWKSYMGSWLISDPEPFAEMDLSPENAFGGPGYARNECGKGYSAAAVAGGTGRLLPNVEDPAHLIGSPKDAPAPAGFFPMAKTDPRWQERAGTYDGRWLKEHWPYFAEDVAPDYFNTAPPDQRLRGYFRGDEAFEVHGMHPEEPLVRSTLPKLRLRCFVARAAGGGSGFEELETRADTLWLFPNHGRGALIYRAVAAVADVEASDVSHVCVCAEPMGDPPPDASHYREQLWGEIEGDAREAGGFKAPPSAATAGTPAPAGDAAASDGTQVPAGGGPPRPACSAEEIAGSYAGGGRDFSGAVLAGLSFAGVDLSGADFSLCDLDGCAFAGAGLSGCNFSGATARQADFSGADLGGAVFDKSVLSSALFRGAKLAGADFSGAEIRSARFERAELSGATFSNCSAAGASFAESSADGPDFAGCDAPGTSFAGARWAGADFCDTAMDGADFSRASLSKAEFHGCRGAKVSFADAELKNSRADRRTSFAGCDFSRAVFERSFWGGADLKGAIFAGARLDASNFSGCDLRGADLKGASAVGARFDRADMSHASVANANFMYSTMRHAKLEEADMGGSNLYGADVFKAVFRRTNIAGALSGRTLISLGLTE